MKKILIGLFFVFFCFLGFLEILALFSNSFASSYAQESWTPSRILYIKIEKFFGELRGTFRFFDTKLSLQIDSGLEVNNPLSYQEIVRLPKVGNDLYLVTGSTAHDFPLYSAVVITSSEKVVSAALLDSGGLAVFLRSSPENNLYLAILKKWAQDAWCSESPVYGGLGFDLKLNQKLDDCRPLQVKIFYLSGYGNRSVN